jgi:hypothetical protein
MHMVSVSRVIPRVLRHYLSGGAHHSHQQQQQRDAAAAANNTNSSSNSSSSSSSSSISSSSTDADSFDDSVGLVDDVDGVLIKSEGVVRDLLVEIMAEIPSAVEQVHAHDHLLNHAHDIVQHFYTVKLYTLLKAAECQQCVTRVQEAAQHQ